MARLRKSRRERIEARLAAGDSTASIARSEGVGYQTVWRLKNGVSRAKTGPRKTYRVLSAQDRLDVVQARERGETLAKIAARYDVSESAVSRVISGKSSLHKGAA